MKITKDLGICMDHASAHIMELTIDPINTKNIVSKFTHQIKEDALEKSEKHMHNKEQHEPLEYDKEIASGIRNYDDVILFGPTDAKLELFNLLKADHLFANIKIEIKETDKMTENQEHAFVNEYFSKR